jgi:hypothetical protein
MAKIVWDAVGERKFEAGVSKAVLYKKTLTDPYGLGVPWNGITAITDSPEGAEPNDMYADGIKYGSIRSAEIAKLTIEAYTYPDEFAECDGFAEPVEGLRLKQQTRKPFGLCYRSEEGSDTEEIGNGDYKLYLVYGAIASPAERPHNTINDSPEAETMSWEVDTTPVPVTGYKSTATLEIDSSKFTPEKMAALEAILYGKDAVDAVAASGTEGQPGYVPAVAAVAAVEPRLPLPAEVITLMTAA